MCKSWGEIYLNHYEKYFGQYANANIYKNHNAESLQLLEYDKVFSRCKVYCSLGLSKYPQENNFAEVFIPIDDAIGKNIELVPDVIAAALFGIICSKTPLQRGTVVDQIKLRNKGFFEQWNKDAIYFTFAFDLPASFEEIKINGKSGFVYTGFFISQKEYECLCKYKPDAFEQLFQKAQVDVYDLSRPSIV